MEQELLLKRVNQRSSTKLATPEVESSTPKKGATSEGTRPDSSRVGSEQQIDPPKPERPEKEKQQQSATKPQIQGTPLIPEGTKGVTHDDIEDDDQNTDLQAAIYASRQAPSTPPGASGSQSSTPGKVVSLDAREAKVLQQLNNLMEEQVDLQTRPEPNRMDKLRASAITKLMLRLQDELDFNRTPTRVKGGILKRETKKRKAGAASDKTISTSKGEYH